MTISRAEAERIADAYEKRTDCARGEVSREHETPHWWFFPRFYIGSAGIIIDREDGRLTVLGGEPVWERRVWHAVGVRREWRMGLVCLLLGCDAEGPDIELRDWGPDSAEEITDGSASGRDCGTHHADCFNVGFACMDGWVSSGVFAPVYGCDARWPEDCWRRQRECAEGCSTERELDMLGIDMRSGDDPDLARRACREDLPAQLGDPCATDDDCRDTAPRRTVEGWQLAYLRCVDGACVEGPAPEAPADYGAPCPGAGTSSAWVPVDDEGCSGGLCARVERAGCVASACTYDCELDSECPAGSRCERVGVQLPDGLGICVEGLDPTVGFDEWPSCTPP